MSIGGITFNLHAGLPCFTFSDETMAIVNKLEFSPEPIERRAVKSKVVNGWRVVRILDDVSSRCVIQIQTSKSHHFDSWQLAKMCRLVLDTFPSIFQGDPTPDFADHADFQLDLNPIAEGEESLTPPFSRPQTPLITQPITPPMAQRLSFFQTLDGLPEELQTT